MPLCPSDISPHCGESPSPTNCALKRQIVGAPERRPSEDIELQLFDRKRQPLNAAASVILLLLGKLGDESQLVLLDSKSVLIGKTVAGIAYVAVLFALSCHALGLANAVLVRI